MVLKLYIYASICTNHISGQFLPEVKIILIAFENWIEEPFQKILS